MMNKLPVGFLDPELLPWLSIGDSSHLFQKTLSHCEVTGSYTRLIKLLPGTDTSESGIHRHEHLEEQWMVEGAIYDVTLQERFVGGMYAHRRHGMPHGPWISDTGAVTLERRDTDSARRVTKAQLEWFDPSLLTWGLVDSDAGVFVKTLTSCDDTGSFGRLVKFHPAAMSPHFEGETARSEVWVVSGDLRHRDGSGYPAGSYGNLEIDLLDGSWTSDHGAMVLELRNLL